MAIPEPKFEPDVVNAVRLLLSAVHDLCTRSPTGIVHPNIARAAALLDDPHAHDPVEAETPDPGAGAKTFPAKVA